MNTTITKNNLWIQKFGKKLNAAWRNKEKKSAVLLSRKLFKDKSIQKDLMFYLDIGDKFQKAGYYSDAYALFKKAAHDYPDSELASMLKYITLVKLKKYSLAIRELDRFLSTHRAKSYKVTLVELLEEMQKGNATKYKTVILRHCKRNNIPIRKYFNNQ